MALKSVISKDQHDELGEVLQAEYKAGEGDLSSQWILDVTPIQGLGLNNVVDLKTALSQERTSSGQLKNDLKAFEGLNVADAKSAMVKVKEMANWTPSEEVQAKLNAQISQLTEKHKKESDIASEELGLTTQQLKKALIDTAALGALQKLEGKPLLLLPHIRNQTRLAKNTDGTYKVEIVDAEGNVRISPQPNTTAIMTVEELVAEMKDMEDYAPAFAGSHQSGAGSPGSEQSGERKVGNKIILSREEARDHQTYVHARERATKEGLTLEIAQ